MTSDKCIVEMEIYLTGVICDNKVPTKMKALTYEAVIRSTLLYCCVTGRCQQDMKSDWQHSDKDGAMGNECEPIETPEKLGDIGVRKDGTDYDGHEKENVGMVRAREKQRYNRKNIRGIAEMKTAP